MNAHSAPHSSIRLTVAHEAPEQTPQSTSRLFVEGGADHKNEIERKYGHIQRAIEAATINGVLSAAELCRLTPIISNRGNYYGALDALKRYGIAGWTTKVRNK
jgi:hypothetical protein